MVKMMVLVVVVGGFGRKACIAKTRCCTFRIHHHAPPAKITHRRFYSPPLPDCLQKQPRQCKPSPVSLSRALTIFFPSSSLHHLQTSRITHVKYNAAINISNYASRNHTHPGTAPCCPAHLRLHTLALARPTTITIRSRPTQSSPAVPS